MKITLEYSGKLTAGYYNDMEAGHPIFIDGEPLSDIVKYLLEKQGYNAEFCYLPFEGPEDVNNPLIGYRVRLLLEIDE